MAFAQQGADMNIDELLQYRLDNKLCTYDGQPLSEEDVAKEWTTCLSCQQKLEEEAREYWTKVYKAEEN
jgi:hypothetical protein